METVAKTCTTELMVGKLNIYIKSRKENVALYDFALKNESLGKIPLI